MTAHFKSDIDEIEAFYLRGDLLRPAFGRWGACDPVCHCILDLVEVQTELADAFDDYANYGISSDAAIEAAVKKRRAAVKKDHGCARRPEERGGGVMTEVKWKCSICRKQYTGFGNSAEPVKQGYCCDGCNESVVGPTRFAQLGFIDLAELKIARPTRH